ncbi:MAG: GNAT family N-acetyltransferase [Chloroflexi bacterium]|nr:GNAT family N-acetyltransferase [Chloroflexota bacterium]
MRRRFEASLVFRPLHEQDLRQILEWSYGGPYAIYDSRPDDVQGMLDPSNAYFAVLDADGELLGFCCFGADARVAGGDYQTEDALDVGGGLRPDLTGKGLGIAFLRSVLDFARQQLHPKAYRVTIAAFNQRAIRMCHWAGFEVADRFETSLANETHELVIMTLEA